MNIRMRLEDQEKQILSSVAAHSSHSLGRREPEEECSIRTAFQRDRDRIIHSKSFRRLKHKTQVFLSPSGDHYRTRLTHTLEVAQISRTIASALRLNEALTEAIALGHDLGHTPFGHAGEAVLNSIFPEGFAHHEQSLRVVDHLEKEGRGLNLTFEVRDGIVRHSKGRQDILAPAPQFRPATLEAMAVRVADVIAYTNHDLDDAIRGGVLVKEDVPWSCIEVLGDSHAKRIDTMVKDLIFASLEKEVSELCMNDHVYKALLALRDFLYDRVYEVDAVHRDFVRAKKIIRELYETFMTDDDAFRNEIGEGYSDTSRARIVCDFIAGMTDRYAIHLYEKLFFPRPWIVY